MPIICDWYHHDCLLSCCSIFKVLCVSFTEVNSFIISHCFQLVKHFFQSFLISFWNRSFNRNRLFLAYLWAFWALVRRCLADSSYIISCPNSFVNTFFWKKSRFFSKKWETPTFSPFHAGFRLILSLKSMQNCCKIPFNIEMIFCVIKKSIRKEGSYYAD